MKGKPTGLSSVFSSDLRFPVNFANFFLNLFFVQKQSTKVSCEKAILKNFAKFQENGDLFFTKLLLISMLTCSVGKKVTVHYLCHVNVLNEYLL